MPDVITAAEYLEIASIPLATPAWRIKSLVPLWRSASQRGTNRLLPLAGIRALPKREGSTLIPLEITIWGHRDREGDPYASPRAGLDANIEILQDAVFAPPGGTTGTRTCIWHKASGSTVTVAAQVGVFLPTELSPRAVRGSFSIEIPNGRFT